MQRRSCTQRGCGQRTVGPGAASRGGRPAGAGAGAAYSRRAAAARGAGARPGAPRALWCGGGTRLLLAAFRGGPRSGAGQRGPPALGWHEEPADPPPPLPQLEPAAGKSAGAQAERSRCGRAPRERECGRRGRSRRRCSAPPGPRCFTGAAVKISPSMKTFKVPSVHICVFKHRSV